MKKLILIILFFTFTWNCNGDTMGKNKNKKSKANKQAKVIEEVVEEAVEVTDIVEAIRWNDRLNAEIAKLEQAFEDGTAKDAEKEKKMSNDQKARRPLFRNVFCCGPACRRLKFESRETEESAISAKQTKCSS